MISRIKETSLYVKDLKRTKQFYQDKLGLKVIGYDEKRHIFFKAGNSILLCFLPDATNNGSGNLPAHSAKGSIHVAFEILKEDYYSCKDKIKKAGIEIIQEQDWKSGLKSFYFRDPDGHLLEIIQEGIWEA